MFNYVNGRVALLDYSLMLMAGRVSDGAKGFILIMKV